MKYKEDQILDEIKKYIESTYTEHYSTTEDGFQVQDMLRHLGIDKDFCQANAIKYLARYGKNCLLYTSPSPRDGLLSRMPSSA